MAAPRDPSAGFLTSTMSAPPSSAASTSSGGDDADQQARRHRVIIAAWNYMTRRACGRPPRGPTRGGDRRVERHRPRHRPRLRARGRVVLLSSSQYRGTRAPRPSASAPRAGRRRSSRPTSRARPTSSAWWPRRSRAPAASTSWVNNAGADILTGAGAASPIWPSSTSRSAWTYGGRPSARGGRPSGCAPRGGE